MPSDVVKVLSNREVAKGIWRLSFPFAAPTKPGQFFMLRCESSALLLPRAISLCDRAGEELIFLYKVVGEGTGELARLKAGDRLRATGPLGNGWPLEALPAGRVALLGGGIGVAPLLLAAKELKRQGIAADAYLGYPGETYLEEEIGAYVDRLCLATESGQKGHKGFVTQLLEPEGYAAVLCCGPTPMMRAAVALCQKAGTPIWVSLETRMACGVGACLVCTCSNGEGRNLRTCKDGPVFRGEEIDFDA